MSKRKSLFDPPPATFPCILDSRTLEQAQACIDSEPYFKCGNIWEHPASNEGPTPNRRWWFHRPTWLVVREDQASRFIGLVWNPPGSALHGRPGWSLIPGWRAIPMSLFTAFISIRDNAEPGTAFCIWLAEEKDLLGYLEQHRKHRV